MNTSMEDTTTSRIHSQDSREFEETKALVHTEDESTFSPFTDIVITAAAVCNKMVTNNCGIFTNYCDKQLQYEVLATDIAKTNEVISSYYHPEEIQACKSSLFDEESVVDSIHGR